MGGKGSAAPPPAAPVDNGQDMQMMMQMMQMMAGMAESSPMAPPTPIEGPAVETTSPIDWASQMNDLSSKAKYDVDAEAAERKSRLSTIHSSLTDDDEETEMTSSLLGAPA